MLWQEDRSHWSAPIIIANIRNDSFHHIGLQESFQVDHDGIIIVQKGGSTDGSHPPPNQSSDI
jgi:hypothetical protein